MVSEKEVLNALRTVYDPEIALNIVEMGLIYGVELNEKKAHVKMTLTNPMCPMQSFLLSKAEEAVAKIAGKENTIIELVWEPKWSPDKMTPDARKKLKM